MSGKILVVGDCCAEPEMSAGRLGHYQVVVTQDIEEAEQLVAANDDVYLKIVCRECFGQEHHAIAQRLDLVAGGSKIPTIILDTKTQLIQALESAHPYNNSFLQAILSQSSIGISIGFEPEPGFDGDFPIFNDAFLQITGRSRQELVELGWIRISHPEDVGHDLDKYRRFHQGLLAEYNVEKRIIRPDGSLLWVEVTVAPVQLPMGTAPKTLCLIKDISDRKAVEQRLFESERSMAVLLENLPGLAYRCLNDRFWTMQFVSEGCLRLTGYPAESLLNNRELSFSDLIAPEYRELVWDRWQDVLTTANHFELEYEIISATGKRKWVLEMGQGVFDTAGNVEALEGIIIDITDRKHHEMQLKLVSEVDLITGLPNRRALEGTLELLRKRVDDRGSLVLFNLRRINVINSTYGYSFCESLLRTVAERLQRHCSDQIRLFQVAYGRFAFFVTKHMGKKEVVAFCEEVIATLKEMPIINSCGCGIGIRFIEAGDFTPETLIHNVTVAAERAEDTKPFAYRFFDADLAAEIERHGKIEDLLLSVVQGGKEEILFLEYQPIIDPLENRTHGFEALARLDGGELGIIRPSEFIPIAEENQLIVPLGQKITELACRFMRRLKDQGFSGLTVYVNVSALQLAQDDYVERVFEIIERTGIEPEELCLEVTESVFVQNYSAVNQRFTVLRAAGVSIAIDDFGTGYSSLAMERELNVNCIKVDKSFIDRLSGLDDDQVIAGDIISMVQRLGHVVVAEGVETETQQAYLIKHNCDLVQGYLFSKPLREEMVLTFLEETENC
ncbi:MAG: EAL domain-containing protein [Firmicutes bacterium]|nr:EAL domain-containing protein [Bacillota bacterium]